MYDETEPLVNEAPLPEPAPADDVTPMAELTAQQYALLDAVRDIALAPGNPAAERAAKTLIRLVNIAFDAPEPETVQREGGILGALFGNPIRPDDARHEPTLDQWPFKTGDLVQAIDGPNGLDVAGWLDAAPEGTVVRDREDDGWVRVQDGWRFRAGKATSAGLVHRVVTSAELAARWAPLTVVSMPQAPVDTSTLNTD
jgi:hypothetical protein